MGGTPDLIGDQVAALFVRTAGRQLLAGLSRLVSSQDRREGLVERNGTAASRRLWHTVNSFARDCDTRSVNRHGTGVEAHVRPPQPAQLTATQTASEQQRPREGETAILREFEKLARLVGRPGLHHPRRAPGSLHASDRVAREEIIRDGPGAGRLQNTDR